jgi:hypothetical protein
VAGVVLDVLKIAEDVEDGFFVGENDGIGLRVAIVGADVQLGLLVRAYGRVLGIIGKRFSG